MLEVLVEHVGDHAQHARQVAVIDLIFEIDDDDLLEGSTGAASFQVLLAPVRRSKAG